jgi:hypothetical protein
LHFTDADEAERSEYVRFFEKVKLCKLEVLLLKLARAAKARDQDYNHVIALYNMEGAAKRVLDEGCFDYREDITCSFHNQVCTADSISSSTQLTDSG